MDLDTPPLETPATTSSMSPSLDPTPVDNHNANDNDISNNTSNDNNNNNTSNNHTTGNNHSQNLNHNQNHNHNHDHEPDPSLPSSHHPPEKSTKEKERAIVPAACMLCRSKHLKCDGLTPCSRCSFNSLDCIYVRSRRGFKGRKGVAQSMASPVSGSAARACPMVNPAAARATSSTPSGFVAPPDNRVQTLPPLLDLPLFDINQDITSFNSKNLPPGMALPERCIEAFFFHFHPAHPIVIPRDAFMVLRKQDSVKHLEAAMRYVGSMYVSQAPTASMGLEAESVLYSPDCPKDAFRVQAMLLLAIGLDGYTHQEKALKILLDAQDQAVELGMNRREFASANSGDSAVLAESWRRTWWEMFVVDGMIAGVHQKSNFRMKDMFADVVLPCEEREYATGEIPSPHTIDDFDNDSFDGRDFSYSSFTYRVAAIRNMGRMLQSGLMPIVDESVIDRLDAYLVNWKLHLPESKREFINPEGQLDEMLFQAHMITEASTIILHREHSELDSSAARNITSCAPHKEVLPGQSFNVHAAKTIKAAQGISRLIQLPVPIVKHTHFFTCVITLASIVHLSCWSAMTPLTYDDDLKQQLRLNTGALKTLWQVWPSAGKAFGQVKGVAQEMFAAKKHQAEGGYWPALTEEEVMRSMIEDETIMNELQLLN